MKYKLLLCFISASLFSCIVYSQPDSKYIGTWEGKLNPGIELRAVFHIKSDGKEGLISVTDSPDQSVYGIPCDSTYTSGESITIEIRKLNATFTGKLINDSTIDGSLTQGESLPLLLKKVDKPSERKRPQLPMPPFPYDSYDVEYDNADKTVHFGATLTMPKPDPNIQYFDGQKFPAVILITGSGQQDRDESLMGHKPFAVIADHLSRNGFAVLRVDDRGMGKTKGDLMNASSADFAKDVEASLDYLETWIHIEKTKIGLIGHSEGGMIAPMVASQRKDVSFIILLAGPGIKIIDLMAEQNAAVIQSSGVDEQIVNKFIPLYKKVVMAMVQGKDSASAKSKAWKSMEKWASQTDAKTKTAFNLEDKESQQGYINAMYRGISSPWFRYFILFDPQPYLQQLNCKVLALNGSRDIQVISRSNLAGIESSLRKSNASVFETKEMPGLNHLFQHCSKCTVNEYGELEETFSAEVLKIMTDWLKKNVQ